MTTTYYKRVGGQMVEVSEEEYRGGHQAEAQLKADRISAAKDELEWLELTYKTMWHTNEETLDRVRKRIAQLVEVIFSQTK